MFPFSQKRRRAKLLEQPFPKNWESILNENIGHYCRLNEVEQSKLRKLVKVIVAEKDWEAHAGLSMSDEIKVTVSGIASLMLLGVDDFYFDNVRTIIVFPQAVRRETNTGWIIERDTLHSGEAHQGGQVVLSWKDAIADARSPGNGHNLVIHEFAHCLDNLDGEMGGSLEFADGETTALWNRVSDNEYQSLTLAVQSGNNTLINDYGATNKAEFFAVCSETFFEKPRQMQQQHSELFQLLVKYYRMDPRNWLPQ